MNLDELVTSSDNLCKQFVPRSGPTERRTRPGSKLFDTLKVFLKVIFENIDLKRKSANDKRLQFYPVGKEFKTFSLVALVLKTSLKFDHFIYGSRTYFKAK